MPETPVGLTKDAGWQIGVSRALPVTPEEAFAVLLSPEGLAVWLGEGLDPSALAKGAAYATADGTTGEVRSLRPGDRIRLTWRPPGRDAPAILQVAVSATAKGCTLRFHSDQLRSADERERLRAHWKGVVERLEPLIAG